MIFKEQACEKIFKKILKKFYCVMPSPPAPLPKVEGRILKELFLYKKTMLARELKKAATREEVIVWKALRKESLLFKV